MQMHCFDEVQLVELKRAADQQSCSYIFCGAGQRKLRWLRWQKLQVKAAMGRKKHIGLLPNLKLGLSAWKLTCSACSDT